MEAFNKILEHALRKVCNVSQYESKIRIIVMLWEYKTTSKKLKRQTPFILLYG
jgi:hypothetical protein